MHQTLHEGCFQVVPETPFLCQVFCLVPGPHTRPQDPCSQEIPSLEMPGALTIPSPPPSSISILRDGAGKQCKSRKSLQQVHLRDQTFCLQVLLASPADEEPPTLSLHCASSVCLVGPLPPASLPHGGALCPWPGADLAALLLPSGS